MNEIKQVSYDFSIDSLVSVKAPIGTDPESLYEEAHNKLLQQLQENDWINSNISLIFENIFDSENGAYDDDWENYGNKKRNKKNERK